MFVAPFTFQPPPSGTLAAPVVSNRTVLMRTDATLWGNNSTGPSLDFPYTSDSGNVLYFGVARSSSATTRTMVPDWNGASMLPSLVTVKVDTALNFSCQAAIEVGGFVGAGTLHITGSTANNNFAYFLGWIMDLDHVRGGTGAAAGNVISVTQDFVEVSLPVSQAGSLLLAAGWCNLSNAFPHTWSAGWTKLDQQQIGTGGQPCGSFASKISTASGAELVRVTGDQVTDHWGIVAVEFLRG